MAPPYRELAASSVMFSNVNSTGNCARRSLFTNPALVKVNLNAAVRVNIDRRHPDVEFHTLGQVIMNMMLELWDVLTNCFIAPNSNTMAVPTASSPSSDNFDIHHTYLQNLSPSANATSDPKSSSKPNSTPTSPPSPHLAAISALLSSLSHPSHKPATATEALSLLSSQAQALKDALDTPTGSSTSYSEDSSKGSPNDSSEDSPNDSSKDSPNGSPNGSPGGSLPASAGLDLFLHYLVNNVIRAEERTRDECRSNEKEKEKAREIDEALKSVHTVGEAFITRGLAARTQIAQQGRKIIRDGSVVILPAPADDLVREVVRDAADAEVDLAVVLVSRGDGGGTSSQEEARGKAGLRGDLEDSEVPFAIVPSQGFGSMMKRLVGPERGRGLFGKGYDKPVVMAPAGAVFADGGVWAEEGVVQAFMLAGLLGVETVVVSELGRMVRGLSGVVGVKRALDGQTRERTKQEQTRMDLLEARYITTFLTEHGVMVPNAVAEEGVRVWF